MFESGETLERQRTAKRRVTATKDDALFLCEQILALQAIAERARIGKVANSEIARPCAEVRLRYQEQAIQTADLQSHRRRGISQLIGEWRKQEPFIAIGHGDSKSA